MAKTLIQVVNQYDVNGLPERCIVQWVDDVTGEDQVIINREDMVAPDGQVFDNYKTLVDRFMTDN